MLINAGGQLDQGAFVQTIDYSVDHFQQMLGVTEAFETSILPMKNIRFGEFCYPLKRILKGYFIRSKNEFVVEGLSPHYVGTGGNMDEAKTDFSLKVHAGIQEYIYKRPFEFTESESIEWETVSDVVDITVFKNTTPVVVQHFGVVSYGQRSYPCKIKWDNGYSEEIDLQHVQTPGFIKFASGQPIRALVRRDPVTREIIDIPHIEKVASLRSAQEITESGLLERIGDPADLPETEWD